MFFLRNELPPGELARRYGTPGLFLSAYDREVDKLVEQRWLLPEDGLRLKADAREGAARQFRRPEGTSE